MFREVELPADVPGRLYLHSMPGRQEPFDEARRAITSAGVNRVICLATPDEVQDKSPEYANALQSDLPWSHVAHAILDGCAPDEPNAFGELTSDLAAALRSGEKILVHCVAGIGRTGTLAVAVLAKLGMNFEEAIAAVSAAGAGPQTASQREFVARFCESA